MNEHEGFNRQRLMASDATQPEVRELYNAGKQAGLSELELTKAIAFASAVLKAPRRAIRPDEVLFSEQWPEDGTSFATQWILKRFGDA